MLAEGIATRRGRYAARLHRDAVGRRLKARRGARLAALTSGGAIRTTPATRSCWNPTRPPSARSTRTSRSSPWRATSSCSAIAPGASAGSRAAASASRTRAGRPPPSRSGSARARRARSSCPRSSPQCGRAWPIACTTRRARRPVLRRETASTAVAPCSPATTSRREGGARRGTHPGDRGGGALLRRGRRHVSSWGHAPFGGRINRAWGMALRKRLCHRFNFELQAAATDVGAAARSARSTASR